MARKIYKTAKGRKFDLDAFLHGKASTTSVGNLGGSNPTNAKGDILNRGGRTIKQKRSEEVRRFYKEELPVVQEQVSIKDAIPSFENEEFLTPEEAIAKVSQPKEKIEPKKTKKKNEKN